MKTMEEVIAYLNDQIEVVENGVEDEFSDGELEAYANIKDFIGA